MRNLFILLFNPGVGSLPGLRQLGSDVYEIQLDSQLLHQRSYSQMIFMADLWGGGVGWGKMQAEHFNQGKGPEAGMMTAHELRWDLCVRSRKQRKIRGQNSSGLCLWYRVLRPTELRETSQSWFCLFTSFGFWAMVGGQCSVVTQLSIQLLLWVGSTIIGDARDWIQDGHIWEISLGP